MKMSDRKQIAALLVTLGLFPMGTAHAQRGGETGGGGDQIAAHYAEVSKRSLNAIKILCNYSETTDSRICPLIPRLEYSITNMKVVPRTRDSVVGADGKPRDAGNNFSSGGNTIFLDVDRWNDQFKTTDSQVLTARAGQILLAVHEPLVLAGIEENDNYSTSNLYVELIRKNNFDLHAIVGTLPSHSGNPPVRCIQKISQKSCAKRNLLPCSNALVCGASVSILNPNGSTQIDTFIGYACYSDASAVISLGSVPWIYAEAKEDLDRNMSGIYAMPSCAKTGS